MPKMEPAPAPDAPQFRARSERGPQGIGARLRRRRKALGLTLADVSHATSLTQGFLSQVEREQANASVRALQRICAVLRLSVGDLFESPTLAPASSVLRFPDAQGLAFGEGATKLKLTPTGFDHLEVLMGVFEPAGSTGDTPYTHGSSEELLVVLAGSVLVSLEGTTHLLGPFDSIHYSSSQPHRIEEATGAAEARVLWAMAPPTY